MRSSLFLLPLIFLAACSSKAIPDPSASPLPTRQNPWYGQDEPGPDPLGFGDDEIHTGFHSAPTFSPSGDAMYWAADYSLAQIYASRFQDGEWTAPAAVHFSPDLFTYRDPFLSPDGKRLYFISEDPIGEDPLPGGVTLGKENLWVMDRVADGWSEPVPLSASINTFTLHWVISVATNYDLYFSVRKGTEFDIYFATYLNGAYNDPVPLGAPVNTEAIEITPNIAPDGSYLLFSRLKDHDSPPHLYITYLINGTWSEPQRVQNIPYCISPIVTPDRKYVLYLSSFSTLAWRDTSFIEQLHP
jgi:hypothetical protein